MASIDFPSSPSTGQSFSSGGKTWVYNGVAWRLQPINNSPGIAATGRVASYSDLASLSPSSGDTYYVDGDAAFYIYDATLGWPAQYTGISAIGAVQVVGAEVLRSTTQTCATSANVNASFDTVVRDDGGMWNAATPDQLTAPVAGWYIITGWAWWTGTTGNGRRSSIIVNGAEVARSSTAAASTHNDPAVNVSHGTYLSAGDVINLRLTQNDGANRTTQANRLRLSAILVK